MDHPQYNSPQDDTLMFAEEDLKKTARPQQEQEKFKLLIVDDEQEIHVMTKLVLNDYQYRGRGIEFISAFSGEEAKTLMEKHPDIACCLLDVVMETKEAGLKLAEYIRKEIRNDKIRIILRTGQPGKAPEKDVILNYDINDYKEKTELTTQKLFTTITTAFRSYLHLIDLEEKSQEIHAKNIRLNEEIARRIVAESNLTKYNRSLERMIESKSRRLQEALTTLESMERQLFVTQKTAIIPNLPPETLSNVESSGARIDANLKKMGEYRQQLTFLLEKYTTLETIILSYKESQSGDRDAVERRISEIRAFKDEINLTELLNRYPEIIQESLNDIQGISRVIRDIKLFISITDEPCKALDINQKLRSLAEALNIDHAKITVQLDLQNVPVLNLPEDNFTKAIQAILENAVAAVSKQGIISVATLYENRQVDITISDIGAGIDPSILPNIFIPYFKGWDRGDKGLGLSFAKSVFLSCGGDISINSTVNEGTTVTITLPCST